MASRKPQPDETALFRAAMHDVKPLRQARSVATRPSRNEEEAAALASATRRPAASASLHRRREAAPDRPPSVNPGIDRRTAERLRKGEIAIEGRLDLHGMVQNDAHAALDRFVRQAWRDGKRMLLVITGKGSLSKGGGVLRRHVPRWLAEGEHAPRVLRIEPAQPRHGGSGAFYLLLRRQRGPS